jgi:dissimilatory sulfite reductase (desulfoviridin) alpha/beta subunit
MQSCPTDAWKAEKSGYAVYAGGKNGRHPTQGEKIADFVDEEQGMMIIARCLDFYLQHGNKRERLYDLIRRVGRDEFKTAVLPQ